MPSVVCDFPVIGLMLYYNILPLYIYRMCCPMLCCWWCNVTMSLDTSAIIAGLFDSSIIGDIECFINAINFATKPNFFWVRKIKNFVDTIFWDFQTNNYNVQSSALKLMLSVRPSPLSLLYKLMLMLLICWWTIVLVIDCYVERMYETLKRIIVSWKSQRTISSIGNLC